MLVPAGAGAPIRTAHVAVAALAEVRALAPAESDVQHPVPVSAEPVHEDVDRLTRGQVQLDAAARPLASVVVAVQLAVGIAALGAYVQQRVVAGALRVDDPGARTRRGEAHHLLAAAPAAAPLGRAVSVGVTLLPALLPRPGSVARVALLSHALAIPTNLVGATIIEACSPHTTRVVPVDIASKASQLVFRATGPDAMPVLANLVDPTVSRHSALRSTAADSFQEIGRPGSSLAVFENGVLHHDGSLSNCERVHWAKVVNSVADQPRGRRPLNVWQAPSGDAGAVSVAKSNAPRRDIPSFDQGLNAFASVQ